MSETLPKTNPADQAFSRLQEFPDQPVDLVQERERNAQEREAEEQRLIEERHRAEELAEQQRIAEAQKERRMEEMNGWAELTGKIAERKATQMSKLNKGIESSVLGDTPIEQVADEHFDGEVDAAYKANVKNISERPVFVDDPDLGHGYAHTDEKGTVLKEGWNRYGSYRSPANINDPTKVARPKDPLPVNGELR